MELIALKPHQSDSLTAVKAFGAALALKPKTLFIDGTLVYQAPVVGDPDFCGVFFLMDADDTQLRLYLILPLMAAPDQRSDACEFVARCSYGRRFGALELDVDTGALRVRIESEPSAANLNECVRKLFDRAAAVAREVSPGWRALCQRSAKHADSAPIAPEELP